MRICITCIALLSVTLAFGQQKNPDKSWPYGLYDQVRPVKPTYPPASSHPNPKDLESVRGAIVFSNSPPVATNRVVPSGSPAGSTNSTNNGLPPQKLNDKR